MVNPLLNGDCVIDGNRVAYGVHGSGQPVVLIHGTPSHSYIWRNVAPHLAESGFQVFVFDLLGFGASERPVYADTSVDAQTGLVPKLMAAWGLDEVRIVAHDIGGAVGLRLAVSHPELVERLVLADTVSYDSWPSETWQEITRNHLQSYAAMPADQFEALLTRQLRMTVSDPDRMTGETLDAYLDAISGPMGRTSFFQHQARHYDSKYTEELTADLPKLQIPVLILWGEDDQWQSTTYAERLHADIPGSQLNMIPKAGHFVMEDAPEAVTQHLLDFLAS